MLIHNADITGSLLVNGTGYNTGSFSGSFSGAVAGTTATASYVEYNSVANKPALVSGSSQITYSGLTGVPSGIVSGSAQVTYSGLTGVPSGIVSGSSQVTYSGLTGTPSGIVSGSAQIASFGIFATTGSNGFNGSQSITGSLTVTGQVVAQTLNVQQVTSSIIYSSGSNVFGNTLSNTQQFTGSVSVTGSFAVTTTGTELQVTSTGVNLGNVLTDSHIISGSLRVNPNGLFVSGSGIVGVGTILPSERFEVNTGQGARAGMALTGEYPYLRFNVSSSSANARNWAFNATNAEPGDFALLQSTAKDGNPVTAGTSILGFGRNGAATFSSSVTAGSSSATNYGTLQIMGGVTSASLTVGTAANTVLAFSAGQELAITGNNAAPYGISFQGRNSLAGGGASGTAYPLLLNPLGGNVGINTASPSEKLEVQNGYLSTYQDLNVNDAGYGVLFYTNGGGSKNSLAAITLSQVGTARSGNLLFATSNAGAPTTKMIITSGGNVGIGTSDPQTILNNFSTSARGLAISNSYPFLGLNDTDGGNFFIGTQANLAYVWNGGTDAMIFATNNAERMRITSGGNVGIGTASPINKLDVFTGAAAEVMLSLRNGTQNLTFGVNNTVSGSFIFEASNSALRFGTNDTERMRITSGGIVMVGTTALSGYGVLNTYKAPVSSTYVDQIVVQGTGNYPSLRLGTYDAYDGVIATTGNDLRILAGLDVYTEDHNIRFYTSFIGGTGGAQAYERMRITHNGFLKASNNGSYANSSGPYHEFISSATNNNIAFFYNTSASPYGPYIRFASAAPNNGVNYYLYFDDTSQQRFIVYSNGGIANFQANNVNLSDERTKKDIEPLESYWDKFKGIEIVKFKYKDQTHDDFNIGVIAQQVEAIAPEFVDVDGWNNNAEGHETVSEEEPFKSIYTADLYHATIKVLQEAMAKIETLETENNTLKSRIEAIEQA
jgi:hypothetical protein